MTKPVATSGAANSETIPSQLWSWGHRSGMPGGTGDVRSGARARLLPPTRSTGARFGGECIRTYDFAGLPEGLKVPNRCGCNPKAFQMRRIVVCERPLPLAIERVDQ